MMIQKSKVLAWKIILSNLNKKYLEILQSCKILKVLRILMIKMMKMMKILVCNINSNFELELLNKILISVQKMNFKFKTMIKTIL